MTEERGGAAGRLMSKGDEKEGSKVRGFSVTEANTYYRQIVRQAKQDCRIWQRDSGSSPSSRATSKQAPKRKGK